MKPTALLLNLFVSLISFIQFYRGNHFQWRIFWPFAITSVPLAFVGGMVTLESALYKKILGFLLLIPIIRFLFFPGKSPVTTVNPSLAPSFLIGASIGFLSGLIGIGGGIILSPILLLLKWTDQKKTAAIGAAFIFVNSLSGLIGQLQKGVTFSPEMLKYVVVAFAGGLLGAYLGALRFRQSVIQFLLAIVLIMAAYKLIFTGA
jgi:uncharacterized membrane protein YfcA